MESAVLKGKPFVVRGHSAVRRLEEQFSVDALAKRLDGTTIEVSHRLCWIGRRRRVDAGRYLRHIDGSQYYWRHVFLDSVGLKAALPEPAGPDALYFDHGWVGPPNSMQTFHQDNHDQIFLNNNLFTQVTGRKYVALASPDDSDFFHRRPAGGGHLRQSAASPWDDSSWEECGSLAETLIEAGDVLYMPPRYWHFVRSLSTSISFSRWWFTNRLSGVLYACEQGVEVGPASGSPDNSGGDWATDLEAFGGWPVLEAFLNRVPLLPRLRFELALTRFYGREILDATDDAGEVLSFHLANE